MCSAVALQIERMLGEGGVSNRIDGLANSTPRDGAANDARGQLTDLLPHVVELDQARLRFEEHVRVGGITLHGVAK